VPSLSAGHAACLLPVCPRFSGPAPMIVRSLPGGVRILIDQHEHARLSAEMAAAWDAGDGPIAPAVVEAARQHDRGWREWDRRPRLRVESGEPHSYRDVPPEDHLSIWERTVAAGWERGEEVGLLVSLHGCRFFARKDRSEDLSFLRRERERQGKVLGIRADRISRHLPPAVAADHARMAFWDGLSLFFCDRWKSPWAAEAPVSGRREEITVRREAEGAGSVALSPFPFRHPITLEAPARRVAGAPFGSQGALDRAVDGAERITLRWRLTAD